MHRPWRDTAVHGGTMPAPKADSAILAVENISKKYLRDIDEQKFFEIVRFGFAQKRKMLGGNLKPVFGHQTENRLEICKLPKNIRAENLTVENWLCLATT